MSKNAVNDVKEFIIKAYPDFIGVLVVGLSGLEPPTPTLSEKCMFLSGFIRTVLNVPKIKAFEHIKKFFDVKQKCTLDIS